MKEKTKQKKSVLGKGMAALLQSQTAVNKTNLENRPVGQTNQTLSIDKIVANKDQPRKIFSDNELKELAASIKENGIIQPLIVRQIEENKFQIIAGERRYRASKLLGLKEVPVVIKKTTEKETMVMAIIENVQREDLNCVEEALAYYNLIQEFKLTQEEVAKKIGKSRSSIANSLRLLTLPKNVLSLLKEDALSFGHGKILVSVKDEKLCEIYAKEVVRNNLSVRDLEELVKTKTPQKSQEKQKKKQYDSELDALKRKLESQTGFHLNIKRNTAGSGSIQIKFTDTNELNSIIEFLQS